MTLTTIILWALFGLIAGAIAKFLVPGPDPGGCIVTILIGVGGAFLGGWLGQRFLGAGETEAWTWTGLITAVLGAVILLLLYRMLAGRGTRRRP